MIVGDVMRGASPATAEAKVSLLCISSLFLAFFVSVL